VVPKKETTRPISARTEGRDLAKKEGTESNGGEEGDARSRRTERTIADWAVHSLLSRGKKKLPPEAKDCPSSEEMTTGLEAKIVLLCTHFSFEGRSATSAGKEGG